MVALVLACYGGTPDLHLSLRRPRQWGIRAGFEPDHAAGGVLRSGGRAWGAAGPRGGSGLLVVHQGVGRVASRELLDGGVPYAPEDLVVQCGPRLVETGGQVGVYRDDGRRFARTALCLRDQGRTLDVILTWEDGAPLRGPGLPQSLKPM